MTMITDILEEVESSSETSEIFTTSTHPEDYKKSRLLFWWKVNKQCKNAVCNVQSSALTQGCSQQSGKCDSLGLIYNNAAVLNT